MTKQLLLTIFLLSCFLKSFGQQALMFIKNRHKMVFYYEGDKLSFRVHGDNTRHTDLILGFEGDEIIFRTYRLHPSEISDIYIDEKTIIWFIVRHKYERVCFFAGAGYLLLNTVNTGEVDEETLVISGGFIAAGFLARWLVPKTMKVRGRRKLVIINLT